MKYRKPYVFLLLPGTLFLVLCLILPLMMMLVSSLQGDNGQFTFSGYWKLMHSVYFQQVFLRSLKLSALSTVISAVVGFPTAYLVSRSGKRKGLLIAMAVFPMLTSPVVRSFSWMVILGNNGMINSWLTSWGLIQSPLKLLYNEISITVGFVQLFLPFMILSLVSVMENIGEDLLLAAQSLGASRGEAFLKVVFPLCASGLITGSVLVFTGCLTAYTTPQLLGGSKSKVISTLIYQDAMSLSDWQSASMVAVVMIFVTIIVSEIINKLAGKMNPLKG